MEKNKKALKLIIIISSVFVFVFLFAAVFFVILYTNQHNIFLFVEKNGLFKEKIEINIAQSVNTHSISLEDLKKDSRVTIDQSLMLINTEHKLPEDFSPDISEYKTTTVYMNNCIQSDFARLSEHISEEYGKKLYVSSDFRTWEEQEELYREDPWTATLPGASEHQSGLALDVYVALFSGDAFLKSPEGRYVNAYSWEYGFIIRYPSYGEESTGIRFEPWHIRYVGQPHAAVIYNNQMTLEEYIDSLSIGVWYEIDGYRISRQALSEDGHLNIPDMFEKCIISPDNTGYYIITIK